MRRSRIDSCVYGGRDLPKCAAGGTPRISVDDGALFLHGPDQVIVLRHITEMSQHDVKIAVGHAQQLLEQLPPVQRIATLVGNDIEARNAVVLAEYLDQRIGVGE